MVPIEVAGREAKEIDEIGPVAAVFLEDVAFEDEEFFGRDAEKFFAVQSDARGVVEPEFIDLGAAVGCVPDDVHENALVNGAENPAAIVGKGVVIVGEAGFEKGIDEGFVVMGHDKEVKVFGVAPAAGMAGEAKSAADHEGPTEGADGFNGFAVDGPFRFGNDGGPFGPAAPFHFGDERGGAGFGGGNGFRFPGLHPFPFGGKHCARRFGRQSGGSLRGGGKD